MHLTHRFLRPSRLATMLAALCAAGVAQADAFTYSGRLDEFGLPANGRYDLRLAVHADARYGNTVVTPIEYSGVEVVNGAFKVDFDLPTGHDKAWVELSIRPAGSGDWIALPGRTEALAGGGTIGQCWSSTGDAGSNPAANFLGTTDAQPLVLRVNGQRALRLEPGTESPNLIGGSAANLVTAGVEGATIDGGGQGGSQNLVTDDFGTVGGGSSNQAGNAAGPVNDAVFATVGGGAGNIASSTGSTVSGGTSNTASGVQSTVSGGAANCAGGFRSWAGGSAAKVRPATDPGSGACSGLSSYPGGGGDQGTFAWADSQSGVFESTGPNQFLIRADGGLFLNTNTRGLSGDDVVIRARQNSGDSDVDMRLQTRAGKNLLMFVSEATGGVVMNLTELTSGSSRLVFNGGSGGGASLSNGGTWTNASSRTFKEGFAAVDPLAVLERLLDLPISTWTYTGSGEGLHLGPVAEDFKAAFGLAGDGKSIATVDADGVALAAIQGLNAKLEAQNAALMARIAALEAALAAGGPD